MSHRENSTAAVNREDIYLASQEHLLSDLRDPRSPYGILRFASTDIVDGGKVQYNFDGPELYREGGATVRGHRANGAQFKTALKGRVYEAEMNTNDFGLSVSAFQADPATRRRMRNGASWDDILAWKARQSFGRFIEQMEILGLNLLGDATTPFDTANAGLDDIDAQGAAYAGAAWNDAGANIPQCIFQAKMDLKELVGVFPDTLYVPANRMAGLRTHGSLVTMYGGNVGSGGLTSDQVAEALELDRVVPVDSTLLGDRAVLCAQAQGDVQAVGAEKCTVIYGYDPEFAMGELGVSVSAEAIPGSAGRDSWVTAYAHCGLVVNPIGGVRLINLV